jgi:hypothetical protein
VLPLPTIELRFLGCLARSLVAILTEISRHKMFLLIKLERNLQKSHLIVHTGSSVFLALHLILTSTYSVFVFRMVVKVFVYTQERMQPRHF